MSTFSDHQTRRRQLRELLGPPLTLAQHRPPTATVVSVRQTPTYRVERLDLDLNGIETVPAYLLVPEGLTRPAGAVLYLHAHGGVYGLGKEELLIGCRGLPAYAADLAQLGLVTLAIDSWCFGERQRVANGGQGEQDRFKYLLWHGQTLWGHMLFDELQALTYLASRPEVDPHRLGVFGMSMGATKAWWLAALDDRIRLCVDLCCLTDYEALIRADHLKGHGVYYYVPGLLNHFQAHEINELIVPRARLSLNGRFDPLTPPEGVERIAAHLHDLYRQHGRPDDCRIELFDCGHEETPAMRRLTLDWLGEKS
ncbi:MAG: alpha/beta hydrolase family protein [Gemmataceae bacterium]